MIAAGALLSLRRESSRPFPSLSEPGWAGQWNLFGSGSQRGGGGAGAGPLSVVLIAEEESPACCSQRNLVWSLLRQKGVGSQVLCVRVCTLQSDSAPLLAKALWGAGVNNGKASQLLS